MTASTESYSALSHLECSATGERYDADVVQGASSVGKPLLARYDLDSVAAWVTPKQIETRRADALALSRNLADS